MLGDIEEVASTLDHLREALDAVVVRGLRACGAGEIARLESHRDALSRAGATHLAESLDAILDAIRSGDAEGPRLLLRARASVRTFERLLTLRAVRAHYDRALREAAGGG